MKHKAEKIRAAVVRRYIETGRHTFISDLMAEFSTSAAKVNEILRGDDFDFFPADRETGDWYNRRTVASPAVEPSKQLLRSEVARHRARIAREIAAGGVA
jgi:hypothetical protein